MLQIKRCRNLFLSAVFIFMFNGFVSAQVDPNKDTTAIKLDTIPVVKTDTTAQPSKEDKKKSKKRSTYIVYGGVNFNSLNTESGKFESSSKAGWHLGASYKRGRFFYWQAGLRYNNARYNLKPANDTAQTFNFSNLDIPVTAGINLLPFLNRIFNIHLFVSAMPAFRLNIGDNTLGVTKNNTNSFNMYGQAGLGFDITFLVLEAGYNYGFTDLLKNQSSNPGQLFINLGFRF